MLRPAIPVTPTTSAVRSMVLDDDLTLDAPSTIALRFTEAGVRCCRTTEGSRTGGAWTASDNEAGRNRGDHVTELSSSATKPLVTLGIRLKRVRERSGRSLREVARELGVSASFLSQMERGKSQPSVATLYSLAQLLKVSIDE